MSASSRRLRELLNNSHVVSWHFLTKKEDLVMLSRLACSVADFLKREDGADGRGIRGFLVVRPHFRPHRSASHRRVANASPLAECLLCVTDVVGKV